MNLFLNLYRGHRKWYRTVTTSVLILSVVVTSFRTSLLVARAEDGLQKWRVTVRVMTKQNGQTTRLRVSLVVWRGLTTRTPKRNIQRNVIYRPQFRLLWTGQWTLQFQKRSGNCWVTEQPSPFRLTFTDVWLTVHRNSMWIRKTN